MDASNPLPFKELTKQQAQRFWKKIIQYTPDKCWPWIGSTLKDGRGQIRIDWNCYVAPRIAWFLYFHTDPHPYDVLHSCDNPSCCNPRHLFLGTQQENMKDASRKGRHGKKLTTDQVKSILLRHLAGMANGDIAAEFGVSETTVSYIGNGHTWNQIS